MTESPRSGAPSSTEEFHEALTELVLHASANGVDIAGGWTVTDDTDTARFDVEIIRLMG
jgi:hypothetical protein